MNDVLLAQVGLDRIADGLASLWHEPPRVESPRNLVGSVPFAGMPRPLPSSAARLHLGEHLVWIPAPAMPPEPDAAPLFLHADRLMVLPTIRLWNSRPGATKPRYRTFSHWLRDAFTRWRFPVIGAAEPTPPRTVKEQLRLLVPDDPASASQLVGFAVRYALFGAHRFFRLAGLGFPPFPMWLRPVADAPFARLAAAGLVVSARMAQRAGRMEALLPTPNLRAAHFRIQPTQTFDWGLDPVHTPEGNDIRLTGRLGLGVRVSATGRLRTPAAGIPLSCATARIPFAGFDDPRRLLMAANMQLQAVSVSGQEPPRVRTGPGDDPPGVNLRVGYLAWRGLNHEDAWVVSESAARRLEASTLHVQCLAIRALELRPRLCVRVGSTVRRHQLLLQRRILPLLLTDSLAVLAGLGSLDGIVVLRPELGDRATCDGEVIRIETWNLRTGAGIPAAWEIGPHLASEYRLLIRVHLHRRLPLRVGDKLANRHGHKGVIGAIVPDDEMPRWRGQPLEALIDPISVLNRSNWGQVLESLCGASASQEGALVQDVMSEQVLDEAMRHGADAYGRWTIEPSETATWLRRPTTVLAGTQFVMRLPQNAADKLAASPAPPRSGVRRRAQRFGEMDAWASWAHGLVAPGAAPSLSVPAARFARLLAVAGFELYRDKKSRSWNLRPCALDKTPPARAVIFPALEGRETLLDAYDRLDAIAPEGLTVLKLDPMLPAPGYEAQAPPLARQFPLRWLPLLPASDRPPRLLPDGSTEPHELTRCLRQVLRLTRLRSQGADNGPKLHAAIRSLMRSAYTAAIGACAMGASSSKYALLRREILGRTLTPSARAVIGPAGPLGLDLDEIGLPPALAEALLGPDYEASLAQRRVWLKRDPVLHRWGLTPVRMRLVAGETVRLPASLLGPLGADFDGDTVALFAALPGMVGDASTCSPPRLARHPLRGEAMFFPGKQYIFGLHLIMQDPERRAAFVRALAQAGTPTWPPADSAKAALMDWVCAVAQHNPQGNWWALLEEHALSALADDPGMGMGFFKNAVDLARLPPVTCGAAKDLYQAEDRPALERILTGHSLEVFHAGSSCADDPIAAVMVAAKMAIGRFGGGLRRLVYAPATLAPADVEAAQCLTEKITQQALSVKGGQAPLRFADFDRQLRRLLAGQPRGDDEPPELRKTLDQLQPVWDHLASKITSAPIPWLQWLRRPYTLATWFVDDRQADLELPESDLRLLSFFDEQCKP